SSCSTAAAGRHGSSSRPRSTTTSSTSTTPVAATPRSAGSRPPKPKPDSFRPRDESRPAKTATNRLDHERPLPGLHDIPIDSHHQHQEDQEQATNADRVQ